MHYNSIEPCLMLTNLRFGLSPLIAFNMGIIQEDNCPITVYYLMGLNETVWRNCTKEGGEVAGSI